MDPVSRPAGFRGWICPICRLPCVCTGPVKGWLCKGCWLMYHKECMDRELIATGNVKKICHYCEGEDEDEDKDKDKDKDEDKDEEEEEGEDEHIEGPPKKPKMTRGEWQLCMPLPKKKKSVDDTNDGEHSDGADTSKNN